MLVPSDKIDTFVENLVAFRTSGKPLSSWTTYRVGPNESLAAIAQKAHMTEAELREANQIPAGRRVKPGSLPFWSAVLSALVMPKTSLLTPSVQLLVWHRTTRVSLPCP